MSLSKKNKNDWAKKRNEIFINKNGQIFKKENFIYPPKKILKNFPLIYEELEISLIIISNKLKDQQVWNEIIFIAIQNLSQDFFKIQNPTKIEYFFMDPTINRTFFLRVKKKVLSFIEYSSVYWYLDCSLSDLIQYSANTNNKNYWNFLQLQLYLNKIVKQIDDIYNIFLLKIQSQLLSQQAKLYLNLQLEQHEKTQMLIVDSSEKLKEKLENKILEMQNTINVLAQELEDRKKKEELMQKNKEKWKNYNKLPPWDPISQNEFYKIMFHCKKLKENTAPLEKFYACLFQICFFLLQITGMRVSNLRYLTYWDLQNLFDCSQSIIQIPLLKSKNKKFLTIAIDNHIWNKIILHPEYNLMESFDFLKNHLKNWRKNKNWSQDFFDFPFTGTYKRPNVLMSREHLTKNLNKILRIINTDDFNRPLSTKPKTTHSFWVQIITNITEKYGIEKAKEFVNHEDIWTTDWYQRSRLSAKQRKEITHFLLLSSESFKSKKKNKNFEI